MKKTITFTTRDNYSTRLDVKLSTNGCGDNQYFSLTVDEYKGRRYIGGGAWNSEDIIKTAIGTTKEQKAVIRMFGALHLSDIKGLPMHFLAKGYYFLKEDDTYTDKTLYKHFRCTTAQLERIKDAGSQANLHDIVKELKLYTQYKREAKKAIKLIEALKEN